MGHRCGNRREVSGVRRVCTRVAVAAALLAPAPALAATGLGVRVHGNIDGNVGGDLLYEMPWNCWLRWGPRLGFAYQARDESPQELGVDAFRPNELDGVVTMDLGIQLRALLPVLNFAVYGGGGGGPTVLMFSDCEPSPGASGEAVAGVEVPIGHDLHVTFGSRAGWQGTLDGEGSVVRLVFDVGVLF